MSLPTVLFVDDEEHLRIAASQSFELAGIGAECFCDAQSVLRRLNADFDGVLVTDIRMPGMDGIALLEQVKASAPDLPVIMVTGHGDVDLAVSCIKNGAYDFIEKPWQPERLTSCVRRAAEQRRLILENRVLRAQVMSGAALRDQLHGRSEVMVHLRDAIRAIATTDVDVLITGATSGIGRNLAEALAREGHHVYAGARTNAEMAELNAIENITAIRLDVTKQDEVDAALETIKDRGTGLYALVNNAGIYDGGQVHEPDIDDLNLV